MLHRSASELAEAIRRREISSVELVSAHLQHLREINPLINAAVHIREESALREASAADRRLVSGERCQPLHGVPFSVKDSIDVAGAPSTAGTLGRKNAAPATEDATLVKRLRAAGAIPIAKTNLPDLLFSFETDNLLFGRTNNPYDLSRTCGGSSGGEAALVAAGGSPLGLGSDCLGSIRVPAAFCGLAAIKPTSGRLPRTGHVPPASGWIEKLWQIGPMARRTEDVVLAMQLLSGEDGADFTVPPAPLLGNIEELKLHIAFFTHNGIAKVSDAVRTAVESCAAALSACGIKVEERRPPRVEQAYELEMAILGADGCDGIDTYLNEIGSTSVHPLLTNFVNRMRPFRASASEFAKGWMEWDQYRSDMMRFFSQYDVVLCPVYPQTAIEHGASMNDEQFAGFSYTMAWNLAGYPAATVRCAEAGGLPINVQVVAKPWRELAALSVCNLIEEQFGGWKPSPLMRVEGVAEVCR